MDYHQWMQQQFEDSKRALEHVLQNMREHRERCRAAGKCLRCGRPSVRPTDYCEEHQRKNEQNENEPFDVSPAESETMRGE